jgi:hypothetical protein
MDERSSKLKYRGNGQVMRIRELKGNYALLETLKGSLQRANVTDLFPLRSRRPYHRINLYEVLRSMLHRNPVVEPDRSWNGVPLEHDEVDGADVPLETDVEALPDTLPPASPAPLPSESTVSIAPTEPEGPLETSLPSVRQPTADEAADSPPPLEHHSPASPSHAPHAPAAIRSATKEPASEFCVPDRILQLETVKDSHGRPRCMVQLGYMGYPDDPVIEPWYDYDDLAEDGKIGWLEDWKRRGRKNLITSRQRTQHKQQLARIHDELSKLECEEEEDFVVRQRITRRRRTGAP